MNFNIITPENYAFVARSFLAGYVIIICRSYFIVGSKPKLTEVLVQAIIFSLLNQFVFFLIDGPLAHWKLWTEASLKIKLATEVLALPACLGIGMGWLASRQCISERFRRLSIPVMHPIERAYDYAFAQKRTPGFVIVTYEDGTVVRAYFGPESLASSDPDRSDLYLERLYSVDDSSNQWKEMQPGRSGYISLKGVRSIEFLDPEGSAR